MSLAPLPPLDGERLGHDPLATFQRWFEEARSLSALRYPDAACLSTVTADGWPRGRIVLVKGADPRGFPFFTNYRSAKGHDIEATPRAGLTFYWDDLARQIRVTGPVERLSPEESDAYFRDRPAGSRLGAWASEQSQPLDSREVLVRRVAETAERFRGSEVPRPPHWGGYLLRPIEVEFWQEGSDRLHDRFRFRADRVGGWIRERLNP